MIRLRLCSIILLASALLACKHADKPSPFTGFYKNYASCREDLKAMDERVDAAGVRDASYYRVPGFPYLRTDRMLASFRHQVNGLDDTWEWTRRMRELDQEARDYEFINLGLNDYDASINRERLTNCGRVLAAIELNDAATMARLAQAAQPADDYSAWARAVGLYPLSAPLMKARLARAHLQWLKEYAAPHNMPDAQDSMRLWTVKPTEDLALLDDLETRVEINVLGYPGLIGSAWRALAERHAPRLLMDTKGENDVPAAPAFSADGLTANPQQPSIYYQIGYTRLGSAVLAQISYFAWFKAAPQATTGPIDGTVWRVTLDPGMQPIAYESIDASGMNHRWYPVAALQVRSPSAGQEPAFIAPVRAPARDAVVQLGAAPHRVTRVLADEAMPRSPVGHYDLHAYEELYTLKRPDGRTRSLFGPTGIVAGAYGRDDIGGISSGIAKAGAPRQAGHQPIARIGRRHFDDPYLLESTFVAPPQLQAPVARQVVDSGPP